MIYREKSREITDTRLTIYIILMISTKYIPYTDLHKISRITQQNKEWLNNNPIEKTFTHSAIRTG